MEAVQSMAFLKPPIVKLLFFTQESPQFIYNYALNYGMLSFVTYWTMGKRLAVAFPGMLWISSLGVSAFFWGPRGHTPNDTLGGTVG